MEQVVPIYSLSVAVWPTAKHWPDLCSFQSKPIYQRVSESCQDCVIIIHALLHHYLLYGITRFVYFVLCIVVSPKKVFKVQYTCQLYSVCHNIRSYSSVTWVCFVFLFRVLGWFWIRHSLTPISSCFELSWFWGYLTKHRDYRARVHTGPGGDTSTSYIMVLCKRRHYYSGMKEWESMCISSESFLFPFCIRF